jgi:hypothetical protein
MPVNIRRISVKKLFNVVAIDALAIAKAEQRPVRLEPMEASERTQAPYKWKAVEPALLQPDPVPRRERDDFFSD